MGAEDDTRSHGISNRDIDNVEPNQIGSRTLRVKYYP